MADTPLPEDDRLPDLVLRYAPHEDGLVDVHVPDGPARPRPLVFYVHGGFWRQAWDRTHARPLAEALVALGYVVALPEYRRVGGTGGWPTTAEDVEQALRVTRPLLSEAGVATTSTTLVGHSAGGHLVLWLANQPVGREDVDRVVALAPVGDLRAAAGWGMGDGAVVDFLGGTPEQVPERYAAADPGARLGDRPASDVVLLHGDADEDVTVESSRGLAARYPWLDYRELPGVDHGSVIDPLSAVWPEVRRAIVERS